MPSLTISFDRLLQRLWQNTKIRTGVYLLPLFALLVFGFFKLLPQTLTLLASNDSFANIISPPEMNSYWLNESFDSYSNSLWKEKHIYKGTTPVNIDSINKEISILSELPVQEDIFQTSTTQSWPIDDLQALKISFKADSITELKAEVSIEVKIENAENQSLAVVCKAQPHENIGSMLCFIQDIEKKAVLSNEIPFTVGEWHTLTMVFIPNRFSVQFFLDNHFYGEIEIPSVEYWRDREFIVAFGSSVSNLEISPLSLTFDNILLSHQP